MKLFKIQNNKHIILVYSKYYDNKYIRDNLICKEQGKDNPEEFLLTVNNGKLEEVLTLEDIPEEYRDYHPYITDNISFQASFPPCPYEFFKESAI